MPATQPHPQLPGGGSSVLYLCPDDGPASTDLYTAWCQRRAAADGWTLTEVITDPDDRTPLTERPGWQHLTHLVTDGRTNAVITGNRTMIADTTRDWVRISDLLQNLAVTLTTIGAACRTTTPDTDR